MKIFKRIVPIFFLIIIIFLPIHAFAHEVYVLDKSEIQTALTKPSINFFNVIKDQGKQFIY